jgi:hypothetical protein
MPGTTDPAIASGPGVDGMPVIVHVLNIPRSRKIWAVRIDGSPDVTFRAMSQACACGRARAQETADSSGHPVTLRVWDRTGAVDEPIHPARRGPGR